MNDDEKYINEMRMMTEQRKAENEKAWNELAIEQQRTKTEKAKHGTGKVFARLFATVIIIGAVGFVATWILSFFFPGAVHQAISIFK